MIAIVKWWNDSKGYGFVTLNDRDYYCHYSALEGEGFKSLREGQEVKVEVFDGRMGGEVKRVTDWK